MQGSNDKGFPPLLGIGLMVFKAEEYVKKGELNEELGKYLNMLSFKELILWYFGAIQK